MNEGARRTGHESNPLAIQQSFDTLMTALVQDFHDTVPYARHLTGECGELDLNYYVRHRIETVKRIWGTARTDALALASMVEEDYEASRLWAEYIAEELNHDRLYLRDLAKHGYSTEEVRSVPQLPATQDLLGFLTTEIASCGALPAVCYSIFVEWNSARYSRPAVDRAEDFLSREHVSGSRSHLSIDEEEDHYSVMVNVASRLLQREHSNVDLANEYLRTISFLLSNYFVQLYESTVLNNSGTMWVRK